MKADGRKAAAEQREPANKLSEHERQRILARREANPKATRPLLSSEPDRVPQRQLDLEGVR